MMRKRELERLLSALVPHAERMLSDFGDFFPYAGVLRKDGALQGLVPPPGLPETLEGWRDSLIGLLRTGALSGEFRATGLVLNVEVDVPGTEESRRAIRVALEHDSGVGYDVYIPYGLEGKRVTLGEPMAAAGRCEVFLECYEAPGEVIDAPAGVAATG